MIKFIRQWIKVQILILKIYWAGQKATFRFRMRCKKPIIRLLNYAHRDDVIDTWKHDLIERIIYGKTS